jgi:L-lactate dehydrogenase complex protein LldG
MTTATRQEILTRIRTATAGVSHKGEECEEAYRGIERDYRHVSDQTIGQRIDLLTERLQEYGATVAECSPQELPSAIAREITASGKRILAAPSALPADWLVRGPEWRLDRNLSTAEIEAAEGVVTVATCAIADSGTIVLHHGPAEGRRILTLLPDWHLCILRTSQVVAILPEYFDRFPQPPALITWISGPSATADIEMTRIKGVHGPRSLTVILVNDTA